MTYITQQNAVSDLISESEFYRIPHRKDSKEDVIAINLKKFAIALEVLAGHPEVMNEYKKAVKSGVNHSAPEVQVEETLGRISIKPTI
jgi:hypothetical protein